MVVSLPEKMIRKCFGGKEKEYREKKKKEFSEKGVKRVFSALWVGKTECVWVGV